MNPRERPDSGSVEHIFHEIDAIPSGQYHVELWVPAQLSFNAQPFPHDFAMALIVDRLLARGLYPGGFQEHTGGRVYTYRYEAG